MHGVSQSAWGQLPLPLDSTLWDHMQLRDTSHPRYVWPCLGGLKCTQVGHPSSPEHFTRQATRGDTTLRAVACNSSYYLLQELQDPVIEFPDFDGGSIPTDRS